MVKAWEEFARGRGTPPTEDFDDWRTLNELTHGTHLTAASRIAEDGQIAGGLIYDGILRQTRTEVVYFSPNSWGDGTRYGAFEFVVDWETLIQGRQIYWVEAIKSYTIPIYRFLLSRRDVTSLDVRSYNPESDIGPIRKVGGVWYWAPRNVAEIVIDEALSLADVRRVNFVKHHDRYCSLKRSPCVEAGWNKSWRAHAAFVGMLLARGLINGNDLLVDAEGKPSMETRGALNHLFHALVNEPDFEGGPVSRNKQARSLIRAGALTLHSGAKSRATALVELIDTEERAKEALLRLVRDHFEDPSFELF